MANTPTNVFTPLAAKGVREDLEKNMYKIAPEEVPFTSALSTTKVTNNVHSWQTQQLDAANPIPTQYIGADAQLETANVSALQSNYVQHFERSFGLASIFNYNDLAGRATEMANQLMMKSLAMKTDIESRFLGNYASNPETPGTSPAGSAGALAWVKTCTDRGVGGTSGGFSNGVVSASTAGTPRALAESNVQSVATQLFNASTSVKTRSAYLRMEQKNKFSGFSPNVSQRHETGDKNITIIGAVDFYLSNAGLIALVPDYYAVPSAILITDTTTWSIGTQRDMTIEDLAKTGDSDKKMLVCDKTLICHNERGSAVITDLST